MDNLPNWYWKKGLHDAIIKKISFQTLDYDYTETNPIRNYILLEIDSRNALFDTKVKSIRFYNAKIVSDSDISGYWWVNDELIYNSNRYILTIYARSKRASVTTKISFDSADVFREL